MVLPAATARLFPHHSPVDLDTHRTLVVVRLLEDGDSEDLRALTAVIPETELARWLRQRGGRQLSARSRAFWCTVLGVPPEGSAPPAAVEALWPL